MSTCRYLIDSNALSRLSVWERKSDFVVNYCRLPSEVLHEARWFPDLKQLKELEYPTTPEVLECLKEVMATVPAKDRSLIDLYANEGNADPMIIACGIHAMRIVEKLLFGETWIIVTNDKALKQKAIEFNLTVCTSEEFSKILTNEVPEAGYSTWRDR